jgi:hypothetical protein
LQYLVSKDIVEKLLPIHMFALNRVMRIKQIADASFRHLLYIDKSRGIIWDTHFTLVAVLNLSESLEREQWSPVMCEQIRQVCSALAGGRFKEGSLYEVWGSGALMLTMINQHLPNLLELFLQEDPGLANSVLHPNSRGYGLTVLNAACNWVGDGRRRIIEILLTHGANPFVKDDQWKNTICACISPLDVEPLRALLKSPAVLEQCEAMRLSPLTVAMVQEGQSDWDHDDEPELSEMMDLLRELPSVLQSFSLSPLHAAIAVGSNCMLEILINAGIDIHVRHDTFGSALECAFAFGEYRAVITLLQAGARLDTEGSEWEQLLARIEEGTLFVRGPIDGKQAVRFLTSAC